MDDLIHLNGIDGVTGLELVAPMSAEEAATLAKGQPPAADDKGWLARFDPANVAKVQGLAFGLDATNPATVGWAVVFGAGESDEVKSAIKPLIDHRGTTIPTDRCLTLDYRPGETMKSWLKRHGVAVGSISPRRVPYYLLLVGDPSAIPFEFQSLLDVEYAVGRLAFDTADEYRRYAESVVDYETSPAVPTAKEVVYWATRHRADAATQMSADYFIGPLHDGTPATSDLDDEPAIAGLQGFRSRLFKGPDATHANLAEILHGPSRPAMLVTASHGMGWPLGHASQRPAQGALLCQDWPGRGTIGPAHYFSAADIGDDACLHGLIAFHFACYGAGTPTFDPFLGDRGKGPLAVAERPFVAALPQRLLSHPRGGALAVIGHVERAWGYSIMPPGVGAQVVPFRNLIGRILDGEPVGHATKDISERFAALSAALLDLTDETRPGPDPAATELAATWIERNDAQNYVVLGDPAVRLRIAALS